MVAPVGRGLPLPTLLSQTLVAFTIEFDNEFEHRLPHRTTAFGSTSASRRAPWLVSLVMWSNCMRFVTEAGISVGELERLARTRTNLDGMRRWGYITIETAPPAGRAKRRRTDWVLRPTPPGRRAREIWEPLFGVIEARWQERFGRNQVDDLRESLLAVARPLNRLPDCLPILTHGLFSNAGQPGFDLDLESEADDGQHPPLAAVDPQVSLAALLSRVLLAFGIEFERDSDVSIAISANLLRVLDERGVQVRELPLLTGVSKEAISMALGSLERQRRVVVEPDPGASRFKTVRLTSKGREAQAAYRRRLGSIEERWETRSGKDVRALRRSLERLVDPSAKASPLLRGLEPYPDGWRASIRAPNTLPHYPMVLHRGGFPDGS
jgi:DNA-binding MarR family transcriptional regulator